MSIKSFESFRNLQALKQTITPAHHSQRQRFSSMLQTDQKYLGSTLACGLPHDSVRSISRKRNIVRSTSELFIPNPNSNPMKVYLTQ